MAGMVDGSPGDTGCSVCGQPAKIKGLCKRCYNIQYHRTHRIKSRRTLPKQHKLMPDDVREIRELDQDGFTQAEIARKFNVSGNTVWRIVHGVTWRDVQ